MSRNVVQTPILGDDFRDARHRAGMSQSALAAAARVSQATVSEIESGRGGMFVAAKVAEALGYDLRLVPSKLAA